MAYKVVVSGDRETALAFRRLGLKASDLSNVFGKIAADVAQDAHGFAPKVTGRLAGDIRPGRAKTKAVAYAGRVSVPYAGPINYGWPSRNIGAARFMNRAADSKADSSAEQIAREMQHLIRAVGLD